MSNELLVQGATLKMSSEAAFLSSPSPGYELVEVSPIVSTKFIKSESAEVLTVADIEATIKSYAPQYTTSTFTGAGTLGSAFGIVIEQLSELVEKDGEKVATVNTKGQFMLSVLIPATNPAPPPPSDALTVYLIKFEVDSNPQTLTKID